MSFQGELLQRGFWLYIWSIHSERGHYIYVGRTGDSSSCNAGSPFHRISRHLNFSPNAKGNSISKQLRAIQINPVECIFDMLAIGPLFPEQSDIQTHKSIRDIVGALEFNLAKYMAGKGYTVIGNHYSKSELDES
jgi:hypothetical protein